MLKYKKYVFDISFVEYLPNKKNLSSVGILTSLNRTTSNWPIAFPLMDPTVKQSLDHYQKSFQGVCPQSDVQLTCRPSCTVVSGRVLPPSDTTLTYEQITLVEAVSCLTNNIIIMLKDITVY